MPLIPRAVSCYRALFRRARLDRDLDDELAAFLDGLIGKKVAQGLDPVAARRAALIEIGGLQQVKTDVQDARVGHTIETLAHDLRYAWRGLRRSPVFATVALSTLAIGVGATVAVFSVVNAVLMQPLPLRDSNRLAFIWSDMTTAGYPRAPLSAPELKDLRTRSSLFEGFGAIWANTTAINGDGDPEQLRVGLVTHDFFSILGAEPLLGRTFRADEEVAGPPEAVVLSWSLWQRRYGGDASIVGRRIVLNEQPATVIGVMPEGFRLYMPPDASIPDDLQAWLPLSRRLIDGPRGQQFLRVVARMRAGVTLAAARQDVSAIASDISRQFPEYGSAGRMFNLVALQSDDVRTIRAPLLGLFVGVAILLLIACVNVAALLVARAASRSSETALRIALGASRGRLLRQCLAEGLLLAAVGGIGSVLVGKSGLAVLVAVRPHALDRIASARIDMTVLLFAAVTALGWGVLCSLSPLAEMWRSELTSLLAQGGRSTRGPSRGRLHPGLVVIQVAFSLVLLVSAGLFIHTFLNIQRTDIGFSRANSATFRVALPPSRYATGEKRNGFARQLEAELSALPGVTRIGAISHLPYDDLPNWGGPYVTDSDRDDSSAAHADYRAVTPGFFDAIGARLIEGRVFTESDDLAHAPVVVVDDLLARRAWPGQTAIGKRLKVDPGSTGRPLVPATVVGVVHHLRLRSVVDPLSEQVYFAERQALRNPMAYIVAGRDPSALTGSIRQLVVQLDPQLPIYDVRPLDDYVAAAQSTQRFTMVLAAAFAAIAVLLAAIGVYGVMAYSVTRRRREFGVRLAIGARPDQVMRLVIREGAALTAFGLVLGIGAMSWSSQLLRTQLFHVAPTDPASYAIAVLVLGGAALVACWIPARRVLATSPIEVLRGEP